MLNTIITKSYYSAKAVLVAAKHVTGYHGSLVFRASTINEPQITMSLSRMAHDTTGHHVGYEDITVQIPLIARKSIKSIKGYNAGIYQEIDYWMADLDGYEIIAREYPKEVLTHDDNDDYAEGYAPPDDDFWHQEIDVIMTTIKQTINECEWAFKLEHPLTGEPGRFWVLPDADGGHAWLYRISPASNDRGIHGDENIIGNPQLQIHGLEVR